MSGPGQQIEIHHRLAKLVFFVEIFHQIGLVDDIDQMPGFRDPPKDPVDACDEFPVARPVGPAEGSQVGMGPPVIVKVPSQERDHGDRAPAAVRFVAVFGLYRDRRRDDEIILVGISRRRGEKTGFDLYAAGQFGRAGMSQPDRGGKEQHGEKASPGLIAKPTIARTVAGKGGNHFHRRRP